MRNAVRRFPIARALPLVLSTLPLAASDRQPDFETDIQPRLTRFGCNSGPCHGKQRGQGGFWLSLLGFDDDTDYAALVHEARGRRISTAAPETSLLLAKATASLPHGGGQRIDVDSEHYRRIRDWIAAGAPRRPADGAVVESVRVLPEARRLTPNESFEMRVLARYSDGREVDVTALSAFQSSDAPVAAVDTDGAVRAGPLPGEATIMVRFQHRFANCRVSIPLDGEVSEATYAELPVHNFIDTLVWQKLRGLGILPSAPASDATFLRRAHLDAIGRLPTPDETRAFLASTSETKRADLVDALLERPEYVDFQANKWADLLRPNPYRVGIKNVRSLDRFLRDAFRRDLSYDEFVRRLVTARGSTWQNGATVIFRDRRSPPEIATMVSQLFLGIRLECAKCHHHPFEVWSQADFYSFSAWFARVGYKGTGLSPPISGGEEVILTKSSGSVIHPRTGHVLEPRPLFGEVPEASDAEAASSDDPRAALGRWLTSRDNLYFARVQANRTWRDLMGRGLVEPVDDLRTSNPATHPELLDALARSFQESGYDQRTLTATIMKSAVYGLSSAPVERNVSDTRNHSRHLRERLRAEVLLDAVADVTDVPTSFSAMPPDSRAVEVWTHRTTSLFLDTFGRPDPNQDPPCERTSDTTVVQALHLMNSPELHRRVTADTGRAARLAASDITPEAIAEELWLLAYCRYPTEDERRVVREIFAESRSRRDFAEDLLWALLNTPEFVFKN